MSEAQEPAQTIAWPALALGAAVGVWLCAVARVASQALPDLLAQQTAMVLAFALALGPCVLAWRRTGDVTAAHAVAGALGVPLATAAWLALLPTARGAAAALGSAALLALPLGAASHAAAAELSARRAGGRMTAWLAAAGAGACAGLLAMPWLGAVGVLAAASTLASVGALGYARTTALRRIAVVAVLACALAVALSTRAPSALVVPPQAALPAELRRLRAGAAALGSNLLPRSDAWDMGARVQSFELVARGGSATGLGALLRDSALAAPLVRPTAPPRLSTALCERTLLGVPYDRPRARVLMAGLGGGLELQCALQHRAARVDVAEPSAAQRDAVRPWLGDRVGGDATRVRFVPVLARAWAARARTPRYDLVVVAGMHEKHTLPPGVLPLPEALAETDRGVRELLSTLAPEGVLWMVVRGEPAGLRLAATVHKALRALGVKAPAGHIAVYRDGDHHGVLAARSALSMNRVIELHTRAKQRAEPVDQPALAALFGWPVGVPELIWTPAAAFSNRFTRLFAKPQGPAASALARSYVFDITPASDDRPLFYEATRRDRADTWSSASALQVLPRLAAAALAGALGLVVLLARRLRPPAVVRSALALGGLGAGQTLFFAFWLHALALWIDRPEQSFALTVLALPGFGLMRLPWRLAARAMPWALSVHALAAAAAVPFAPLLVLWLGHSAVAIATVLLFVLAAAVSWYPLRDEPRG